MFEGFNHFVAYGSSDQQTMRELRSLYDGLVVPATIAAMQGQATGGFVLAMTAKHQDLPYVIDSRFPLFQRRLDKENVKPSHSKLADILGDEKLINPTTDPVPADFSKERIEALARRWVEFNGSYENTHKEKFDKYAERLGEATLDPDDAQDPNRILPLYFVVTGPDQPWWAESEAFWQATASLTDKATRLVAVEDCMYLARCLEAVDENEIAVWASGLDEMESQPDQLVEYASAIAEASQRGKKIFALYGGYFHVLLRTLGLTGLSHGIGFGEHRDWEALSSSGGPPPRFYLPRAHRYFPQDLAQVLWDQDPEITACPCSECKAASPGGLSYHALMRHSVRVRDAEIRHAGQRTLQQLRDELVADNVFLTDRIAKVRLTKKMKARSDDLLQHMDRWVSALDEIRGRDLGL